MSFGEVLCGGRICLGVAGAVSMEVGVNSGRPCAVVWLHGSMLAETILQLAVAASARTRSPSPKP